MNLLVIYLKRKNCWFLCLNSSELFFYLLGLGLGLGLRSGLGIGLGLGRVRDRVGLEK